MDSTVNLSRIVVKFSGSSDLFSGKAPLSSDSLLFQQGKTLSQLFPGSKLSQLFWSVDHNKIASLVKQAVLADKHYHPTDFSGYYAIDYPDDTKIEAMLKLLLDHPHIEYAYPETGRLHPPFESKEKMSGTVYQHYLENAPFGINAYHAWSVKGGDGLGSVKFIDIEQGWILDHESYQIEQLPSTGINAVFFRDHGAAVLGVMLMNRSKDESKGIVPRAKGYVISQWRPDQRFNTADAIVAAIEQLRYGDILLLETQIQNLPGDEKLWPIEIKDANFQAIRLATALGIIVIEAGGNGGLRISRGNDLGKFKDHLGRSLLLPGSDSFRDSGAILVAAGSASFPHEKISFSNYGDRIDCYAQGELVFTAGSLPASSGKSTDSYTLGFGGTSSAAAIIAGAAIALQSIAESNYHFRLSPCQLRNLFRNDDLTTTSARGRVVDKIGAMPDLKRMIEYLEQFSKQLSKKNTLHQSRTK